jgi:predicted transposase YbfD/YdcC
MHFFSCTRVSTFPGCTFDHFETPKSDEGMVESERHVDEKVSVEKRFYIASINKDAELLAKTVREHWGIENRVHWVFDVAFQEDDSRIRKDYVHENLAVIHHISLDQLRSEKSHKVDIKAKKSLQDGMTPNLLKVLGG